MVSSLWICHRLKNDADADPTNEIQDLSMTNNVLSITNKLSPTGIDLSDYLQQLVFTPADNNLEISGGNKIDLSSLKDDADADPVNEIQDLSYNSSTRVMSLSNSSAAIDLSELKDDSDSDPLNEIQDLSLTDNKLKITNKTTPTEIDLSPYLDNTDNQSLSYNSSTNTISLTNGGSVNLGSMVAFKAGIASTVNCTF